MPDKDAEKLENVQQKNQANAEIAKKGAKVAANTAFGPLGGKAVDLASKTKLGQNVLNKAGNQLGKQNPFANPLSKQNPLANPLSKSMSPLSNMKKGGVLGGIGAFGASKSSTDVAESEETGVGNETVEEQAPSEEVAVAVKKGIKKALPLFSGGCLGCLAYLIIIVAVIVVVMSPILYINEIINKIQDKLSDNWNLFLEKVNNIPKCGFMSDEKCEEKKEKKIYKIVEDVQKSIKKKYEVSIDVTLLMSTLTYYDIEAGVDCDIEDDDCLNDYDFEVSYKPSSNFEMKPTLLNSTVSTNNMLAVAEGESTDGTGESDEISCYESRELTKTEKIEESVETSNLDSIGASTFDSFNATKKIAYELGMQQVTKYIDYFDVYSNCSDGTKSFVGTTNEDRYELDEERFKEFLPSLVKKVFYNDSDDAKINSKSLSVTNEIFDRRDYYSYLVGDSNRKGSFTKTYAYCSGVTVPVNGELQVVPLEDYIAGVSAGEMGGSFDIEALKAHAIAARTYVLSRTKNCTETAGNSASFQVYNPNNISDINRQAAEETAGLVLIYEDSVFSTMYDSFCYNDSNCPDAVKNADGSYSVTYTKQPNGESHKITLSDSKYYGWITHGQGHGMGMSQLVAGQMANEGKSYEEILEFFYSPGVQISEMRVTSTAAYASSSEIPTSTAEVKERSEYYSSLGVVNVGGQDLDLSLIYNNDSPSKGECVWYARGRMLELIYSSDMPDAEKAIAYMAVATATGNGDAWYDGISNLDIFEHNPDYTQPHAGAFVSWYGGKRTEGCPSKGCGHVAVIESVDFDTSTVVISEGWHTVGNTSDRSWPTVNVATGTYSFDELVKKRKGDYYDGIHGYVYVHG